MPERISETGHTRPLRSCQEWSCINTKGDYIVSGEIILRLTSVQTGNEVPSTGALRIVSVGEMQAGLDGLIIVQVL